MDTLKKFFPFSFKFTDTTQNFIIGIILHAVAMLLIGAVMMFLEAPLSILPEFLKVITDILISTVESVIDLYITASLVIHILVYAKVIK